ncbi:MAG: hypothetical protein KGM16_02940 [Bacteroidota bacterium]|nr:hypothetical protein [Bacteroidota bacterium]
MISMSFGILFVSLGILFFMLASPSFEADQIIHFKSGNHMYETRRYSLGGATLPDTKYTFETYREFKYLPIEHEIDKTEFYDSKIDLDFLDPQFKIDVIKNAEVEKIIFSSEDGKEFEKTIN